MISTVVLAPAAIEPSAIDPDQFTFLGIVAVLVVLLLAAILAAQMRSH
jgi:hypothetical protein